MADSARSSFRGCVTLVTAGASSPTAPSYHDIKAKHQQASANRKRRLWKGLVSAFVVLTIPVLIFNVVDVDAFGPGVTFASYRRLHVGMCQREVEAILEAKGEMIVPTREEKVRPLQNNEKYWKGEKLVIYVAFAPDNRARQISMTWNDSAPRDSLRETLSRWFTSNKK